MQEKNEELIKETHRLQQNVCSNEKVIWKLFNQINILQEEAIKTIRSPVWIVLIEKVK